MIKKISKRMRILRNSVDLYKKYSIDDGLSLLLKKSTCINFIESVDVSINLGIDPRKSDQNIRNYVMMPHGVGRNYRVAVFTKGDNVELAKRAGADLVGLEDLCEKIIQKKEKNKLDVVLASPDVMHVVGKLGSVLGPRGLMPNLKMGTISQDLSQSLFNIKKKGQVRYRNDKNGIVHAVIGKTNFNSIQLKENLEALLISLKQVRPTQCKGIYIKKISISTTMGISVMLDNSSMSVIL